LKTKTFVGTPEYLAPEMLQGLEYGKEVDWWSLGTLMYELLEGNPPFYAKDVQEMYAKILSEPLKFTKHFSKDAKDLISKFLERDPAKRLKDPKKIRSHAFFKTVDWDKLLKMEIAPPYRPPVSRADDTTMISSEFLGQKPDLKVEARSSKIGAPDSSLNGKFADFTYVAEHLAIMQTQDTHLYFFPVKALTASSKPSASLIPSLIEGESANPEERLVISTLAVLAYIERTYPGEVESYSQNIKKARKWVKKQLKTLGGDAGEEAFNEKALKVLTTAGL